MREQYTHWLPAPADLILCSHAVHVWWADLNVSSQQLQQFARTLAPDEQQRAARFYFERDRNHFTAGRGILRSLLARYLHLPPEQLQFSYASRGKPALATLGTEKLQFNLSHSHGMALYAIALDQAVGIDLEYMRPTDVKHLAKRFFSAREYAIIRALPSEQQQAAFFNGWTRKEAYLKATGDGLIGLEQVEVSLAPTEPAQLLTIASDPVAASRWLLQSIHLTPDYAAALAVEDLNVAIAYWQWVMGDG